MITPTFLLTLFAQAVQSPLVDVPAGWLHERLELPPGFAPDLGVRGIEDLSFAPGMFQLGSPSYFSYALALRMEGDVDFDEAGLARFLESYYRGLYHAVAADRPFKNDESTIRARVRREGAGYRAVVSTFDAFTDGRALELAMELDVHSTPRTTELLGLASPLPSDAPIWAELRALAKSWHAKRPPPVLLNHVYFVVDRETYDAAASSSFLRDAFAVVEERTTRRADTSYSGLYFYGHRTYFELLPPGAAGLSTGATGIAFGVESEGAIDALSKKLETAGVPAQGGPITRELDGKQVPWFQILGVEMPASPLAVFAMEYEPRFLQSWHADLAPKDASIARSAVLERYAASLKKSDLHTRAPFADVSAVHVAANDAQRARLRTLLTTAGFEIDDATETWTCHGPQFRLVIAKSAEPSGITRIDLALRTPVERERMQLGKLALSFDGKTATMVIGR